MPTHLVARDYPQTTCAVRFKGAATEADNPATLTAPVTCEVELQGNDPAKTFSGDHVLLRDLIATVDRYLGYLLRGEPQGTFSGSVALRPLDALTHRLTLRQGDGIGQADLSMTQLYDLAESLGEVHEVAPNLEAIVVKLKLPWYNQPTGIAAIAVAAIGLVAGVSLLIPGGAPVEVAEDQRSAANAPAATSPATSPVVPPSSAPAVPSAADSAASSSQSASPPVPGAGLDEEVSADAPERGSIALTEDSAESALADGRTNQPTVAVGEAADDDLAVRQDARVAEQSRSELATATAQAGPEALLQRLQSEWQSPAELESTLIYSVMIAPDGTIATVEPETEPAAEFLDRTPLVVDTDASLAEGEGLDVQVELGPDNAVSVQAEP